MQVAVAGALVKIQAAVTFWVELVAQAVAVLVVLKQTVRQQLQEQFTQAAVVAVVLLVYPHNLKQVPLVVQVL
jgi:hypothetical protein